MESIDSKYKEALKYIFEKLPMFSRVGAIAYKADLNNIIELCKYLDNPHLNLKTIHVAGTNGKGSCSHMLASVLQCAGYKTGLYTSPHIIDFRERIKINGIEIPKDWVVNFIDEIKPTIEQLEPSFFEITVAMAFAYFNFENVDIAIIEVGLGGLLDSTNIIIPEISLITNISFDHTNLLGNTIQEIAVQKAGIIKERVPVVIGETQEKTQSIFFTHSVMKKSPIFFADQLYSVVKSKYENSSLQIDILNQSSLQIQYLNLDLQGTYQLKNIKSVLSVIDVLKSIGWNINQQNIETGLANVKKNTGLLGRFETIQEKPKVIYDVSHNEAGLTEVFNQINKMAFENLYCIIGFVKDKDIQNVILKFPTKAFYISTQAQIERALSFNDLHQMLQMNHLNSIACSTVTESLNLAISKAQTNDVILVLGSFFIMEEAYSFFKNE